MTQESEQAERSEPAAAAPETSDPGPPESTPPAASAPAAATPMFTQYFEIKEAHPDHLLFYRMGDFYEMFFDDAVAAAAALDITLTKRGKQGGADIPMCGVPVHSHEVYLQRLIRRGFKVAICEQVENPAEAKKRGAKALVRREVVRVITPGTLTEDALLESRAPNYLAALARAGGETALAWLDMSTGAFEAVELAPDGVGAELARLAPGEILLSERLVEEPDLFDCLAEWKEALTLLAAARFDSGRAERRLCEVFRIAALDAFGTFSRASLAACGALVDYVALTQKGRLPHLAPPRAVAVGATLAIDAATRRNLELTASLSGERSGSLLGVVDRTVTGAGGRLLLARLAAPLTDADAINARLDAVAFFADAPALRERLRAGLKRTPDIERSLSRLTVGRGGPRDLAAIRDGLAAIPPLRALVEAAEAPLGPPEAVSAALRALGRHGPLTERLGAALVAEPGLLARDGNFIVKGYTPRLDELLGLRDEGRRFVLELEARYREDTGVASLKIRHNNVLGYFVEVTPTHAEKIAEPFIHRQTLASAVRYATVELGELEDRIRSAGEKALALELELFADLVGEVTARADEIARAARALAELDVGAALAELAVARDYARPRVDDSLAFVIENGRHPVVEAVGLAAADAFVANDADLGEASRLWLLTGPNMAGKSTFLRQNALIAVLAQSGSFVPASAAHLGVVDRLFSRVGAADDLARGRSTFMVEMVETAAILNQASRRSLVILDEIGRGTATFDGLSIAWATLEHLHEVNRCRALFATHYHELTALAASLDALVCRTMRVKEWKGDVVFLHEVASGTADRSYGIHVGRLAGLPGAVVARAEEVLASLEGSEQAGNLAALADDLPLFSSAPRPKAAKASGPSPAEELLGEINADELSPREALDLLYRLKALLAEGAAPESQVARK